jgi:ABC-2 type transport system ATP-binding protein
MHALLEALPSPARATTPALRASGLRKSFGSIVAVDGIDLEVRPGETFGLLGPNGAGKTTTLSMICGALAPDAGTVDIGGAGAPTEPQVRRLLGVAPQSLALYADLTARENLAFFGGMYGLRGQALAARVTAGLTLAGLERRADERIVGFSGGMKRRLNLACALLHEPPLVLLDEPTAGVDPQSRNLLFERLAELRSAGRTIVYTTHAMEEAERLCDRVAIVDHGRVVALDTVDGLIERHGGAARVEVEVDGEPSSATLAALPFESRRFDEGRVVLEAESAQPFALIAAVASAGLGVRRLRVDRPDLETVFLRLTGRSLRDQ